MTKTIHTKNSFHLLSLFFLTACLQNIALVSFGDTAIKLYHVVGALMFPSLIMKKRIILPPKRIIIFGFIIVFVTIINAFGIGINPFIINYMFAFYALILVMNIGRDFSIEDWCHLIQNVAVIMSILIWFNIAVHYTAIIDFIRYHSGGHPIINTYFGGGVNLEASYLAIMGPTFFNDKNGKKKFYYYLSTVLICVLYSSRTAILICLVCIIMMLKKERIKKYLFLLLPVGLPLLGFILTRIDISFFLNRFNFSMSEPGVMGRFRMWQYAFELFKSNPIGFGIGNSIPALIQYSGLKYTEDNFHNLYMQMFIDLGVVGGLYYIALIVRFILKEKKRIFTMPLQLMMLLYFTSCMSQFRGAEIIIYFFFAAYFQQLVYLKNHSIQNIN